ncbi:MAG: serine hydrolase domain-containing protein [Anaerolineales bacterium]|nr:serine hydrolase domain-containing protein [Anaerolineales bacterium]
MPDYDSAFTDIDRAIRGLMAVHQPPSLSIAVTDRDGMIWQAAYGYADLAARAPASPVSRYEIGSVGKSFTCLALLKLHEMGRLDLHAPVTDILPWLEIETSFKPITVHHLMSHTSGLPVGADSAPSARYEAWNLRRSPPPYAPGERFHYSNVGFKLLGFLVEDVSGRPYGDILQEWVLDPIGMPNSDALTTHDSRRDMAVGYETYYDDRPWHPDDPLMPAPWFEYGAGDGSPVCDAADLAAYLRMLLNRGRGGHGRVINEDSFALMTQKAVEARGAGYGYGLSIQEEEGRTWIGHNGGTVGYLTTMLGDLEEGLGVVIFINGPGNCQKDEVAAYTLKLLRAVRREEARPDPPESNIAIKVESPQEFAGSYRSKSQAFEVEEEGGRLWMRYEAERLPMDPCGGDSFYVRHPALQLYLLNFQRENGQVVGVGCGPALYLKEGAPRTEPPEKIPPEWLTYTGHYRAYNPWFSNFRIFLRSGRLYIAYKIYQASFEVPIVPLEGGGFQVEIGTNTLSEEPYSPERLRFDTVINGKAQRALAFGGEYYRTFTP